MEKIIIGYAVCIAYFASILILSKISRDKLGASDEVSRKIAHIMISFIWLLFLQFAWRTIHFFLMPLLGLTLIIIGFMTKKLGMLLRDEKSDSEGIILYITSVVSLAVCSYFFPSTLVACTYGLFALAFGDGFAALVGKKFGKYTPKIAKDKSLAGSTACFIFASAAMILVSLYLGHDFVLWKIAILALTATVVEIFGKKLDNLLIGLSVAGLGILLNV